jgi:single-strand DNA-binding protein
MARGLNKAMLIGRLGGDPEIRYTASGTAVANFTLATNHGVKRGDKWEEETEWHRIVAWDRLAEIVSQYLHTGSQLYIEGRIQTREWQDRDGNRRWTTEIIARDIQMLGGRDDVSSMSGSGAGGADSGSGMEESSYNPPGQLPPDDEVPF